VYAELVFDSSADDPASGGERHLRFEHPDGRVELVVAADGDGCVISGWAEPPPLRAELEPEGQELALVWKAAGGTLVFRGVPSGLIRVRLEGAEGSVPVYTTWVRV
jgi:hypothetical protein